MAAGKSRICVGCTGETSAFRFGRDWAKPTVGGAWRSARVTGTVVAAAGRRQWKVRWDDDADEAVDDDNLPVSATQHLKIIRPPPIPAGQRLSDHSSDDDEAGGGTADEHGDGNGTDDSSSSSSDVPDSSEGADAEGDERPAARSVVGGSGADDDQAGWT